MSDNKFVQPPTREQIAEATLSAMAPAIPDRGARTRASKRVADAIIALFPKSPTHEQIHNAARQAFAEWYETDETGDGFLRRFDDAVLALLPQPQWDGPPANGPQNGSWDTAAQITDAEVPW